MKRAKSHLLQEAILYLSNVESQNRELNAEVRRFRAAYGMEALESKGLKMIKVNETITITRTINVELNDDILLNGIRKVLDLKDTDQITSMTVGIPGGGDYSNMQVSADTLTLTVVIQTTSSMDSTR